MAKKQREPECSYCEEGGKPKTLCPHCGRYRLPHPEDECPACELVGQWFYRAVSRVCLGCSVADEAEDLPIGITTYAPESRLAEYEPFETRTAKGK